MAITAENLAKKYGVSRAECDEFALASQERALAAQSSGYFAQEIVGVDVPGPKGSTVRVEKDEESAPWLNDGKTRQTAGALR